MPRPSPKKSLSKSKLSRPKPLSKKAKAKLKVENPPVPFYIEAPLDKMNAFSRAVFENVLFPFFNRAHNVLKGDISSDAYWAQLLEVFFIANGRLAGVTINSVHEWSLRYEHSFQIAQSIASLQQHGDITTPDVVQESRPPEAKPIHEADASQHIPALGVAPPAPTAYGVDPSQVAALGQGMGGMAPPGGPPRVMFTG